MMDQLLSMARNGVTMLQEFWPVKVLFSVCSAVFCYLFGGSEAILLAVLAFIILDTMTKWAAVTRQFLLDRGVPPDFLTPSAMLCGFVHAWQPGYLTSTAMRVCWGEKIFTYAILIIFAGFSGKLPEMMISSIAVNKSISGGIYAYIALTELLSIVENLEAAGNTRLARLKDYACKLSDKITGGSYSLQFKATNKEDGAAAAATVVNSTGGDGGSGSV